MPRCRVPRADDPEGKKKRPSVSPAWIDPGDKRRGEEPQSQENALQARAESAESHCRTDTLGSSSGPKPNIGLRRDGKKVPSRSNPGLNLATYCESCV